MNGQLTSAEVMLILDALSDKYGRGYSKVPEVGHLQAKLSILLEVAHRREDAESANSKKR